MIPSYKPGTFPRFIKLLSKNLNLHLTKFIRAFGIGSKNLASMRIYRKLSALL